MNAIVILRECTAKGPGCGWADLEANLDHPNLVEFPSNWGGYQKGKKSTTQLGWT